MAIALHDCRAMRSVVVLILVAACAPDSVAPEPVATSSSQLTVSAISRGSTWRYWDNGGDLGTSWRGTFDDASWSSGAGPLGYGEPYLATTVDRGPITTYFRRTFVIDDPAQVAAMSAELMYDDGAVVYLNGTEVNRFAMPTGTVTAGTLSTGHEANNTYAVRDWNRFVDLLVPGTNVVAVEVHQSAASSSDLVFDFALTLEELPPVEMGGIARGARWYYQDDGHVPVGAWKTHPVPGGDWKNDRAPLGYGESYLATTVSYGPSASNKYITTYFRRSFEVDNPTTVTSMLVDVMYDDGFVAYLNGVEVLRRAMPSGPIGNSTRSTGYETGNAYERFDLTDHLDLVVGGQNIVAVEVHQAQPTSSDLTFDLALMLSGEEPPPPPDEAEDHIARASTWTYYDDVGPPSDDDLWADPDYVDAAWSTGAGPFGYGESYVNTTTSYGGDASNKTIATYFRKWFTVDDPTVRTSLAAELMYDDGVIIHINGVEVTRLAMPDDWRIEHDTLSTGYETGNAYEPLDLSAGNVQLVDGLNVIAVEVHQAARTSSDLTFDLALEVDTPAVCAIPGCGPAKAPAPPTPLQDVWVGDDTVWVVGWNGTIGRRSDGDGAWCWCALDTATHYDAVWGSADDDVWIAGSGGRVVHYDGTAMTTVDVGATTNLRAIWGTGASDVWLVGAGGTVRHYDGASWQARNLGAGQNLRSVWGASASDVWVVGTEHAPYPDPEQSEYDGSSGLVYRWIPATASWELELINTVYYGSGTFDGIQGSSVSDVYVVGSDHPAGAACSYSGAFHYDGASWTRVAFPNEENGCRGFQDVVAGAPGGVWIVGGAEKGALQYDGATWIEDDQELTEHLTAADHRGDELWAVGMEHSFPGSGQKVIRWNGTSWVRDW